MKRLAVFCDGTWNELDSRHPTNVVLASSSVLPRAADGTLQITYYDEGVGTSHLISKRLSAWLAGAFGLGLFDKVANAYRFLVLNYDVGDEIYIFGFSRGAYTARSLAGMIRNCGIIAREQMGAIPRAHRFYRERTPGMSADSEAAMIFRAKHAQRILMTEEEREWRKLNRPQPDLDDLPILEITYLGVWDTVGALGIPNHVFLERLLRTAKKHQFHDCSLSDRVAAARHAVAIDEDRRSFVPTLWDNLDSLNTRAGATRYEQQWFPGDHGSVGGGGDISGLSNEALLWVLEGAQECGLELDERLLREWRGRVDRAAPLRNRTAEPTAMEGLYSRTPRDGPSRWDDLSESAKERLLVETRSPERFYRPLALRKLYPEIDRRKGAPL